MKKNNSKIQFLWEGKEEALLQHLTPPSCTYEQPNDIQGNEIHCVDNLDFLKLNQERLRGKVKCIYIDPPYNTGNDFIYKDKRHSKGECKHSKWLSFMYPRLVLARELLQEDGVIFISIDDNEQAYLKVLCDEIFGEENFVGAFPRITKKGGKSSDYFAQNHDYILLYTKNTNKGNFFRLAHNDDHFNNQDEYFEERGFYKLNQTLDYDSLGYVKSLDYPIEIESKTYYAGQNYEEYQKRQAGNHGRADWGWRWSKDLYEFGKNQGFVVLKHTKNGSRIYTKTYQNATIKKINGKYEVILENRTKALSTLALINDFSNDNSKSELSELIGDGMFDYPKPVSLIKHLLKISSKPNSIILDFFAGSGTTGQAVMELNQEEIDKQAKDGLLADKTTEVGGRKFILVQLPEKIDDKKEAFKAGYRHISDITIERVRRAGAKYKGDVGFKVFDCIKKTELLEKYQ
jgi:adenine-specific DNA-methyltransferase